MILDKNYIETRIIELIREKNDESLSASKENDRLYRKKLTFPYWIRIILFNPYNPIYVLWKQYKIWKRNKTKVEYTQLHSFSVDFITYCLSNNFSFNTEEYFIDQDDSIRDFVDGRIKSFLTGFKISPFTEAQKKNLESERKIKKETKYRNGFYRINRNGMPYYLPLPSFYAYVFDLNYGLNKLPLPIINSLEGKDFLDIGAAYGDTSIMLMQYKPRKIYAYEPVKENYDLLLKTIEKNNFYDTIIPIKKGLGETQSLMEISSGEYASSLINNFQNSIETESVEITTIDYEITKDSNIGLIKIDVEGFEYFVVKGGMNIIERDNPILLISVYHTGRDFFEILPLIHSKCPEYKFLYVDMAPHLLIAEKIVIAYVA